MKLQALLEKYAVAVGDDNAFQRRARLLQSLWREARGLPMGERRPGVPLGSRLPLPFAESSVANFFTENIRRSVDDCVAGKRAGSGQLVDVDRLYANLLSSQPLCFNLFGELQTDLLLATRVFGALWPTRVQTVTAIRFEYSPGRSDLAFTGDRSAFDVFIEHTDFTGGTGFIGIEVKYHEDLVVKAAEFRLRYDEVAKAMACFSDAHLPALRRPPLQQIWRDHLLAGSMLATGDWATGLYVFLYPEGNVHCAKAVDSYAAYLTDRTTFEAITLDRVVDELGRQTDASWVSQLRDRYLGWGQIEALSMND